ncbi:hypothetical protein A2960_02545 [Candidatus Gottesmanbacteria bacterium RIFCSPLOWO2_01_FULL_39_12b]|uniref:DUF5666 domain-containing protein n=1 Tax=Candidatus Gottesmanbacteria bacterium RIFCSPLOWO2_01_FULL_39_12b TaxID=1798388 RepID=A0A1F6AQN1_9BACT|nr:MAG: hypothetical protein A2960_02545 [Candidatus Gottesmanbacteria bacterium RIFCSPLOWO2_01_FULL_39_12b]
MKIFSKILFLFLVLSIISLKSTKWSFVHAQTTQNQSSTPSSIIDKLKQIEILKEKIATKVAEIRDKDKAGVGGVILKKEQNSLTLQTNSGQQTVTFAEDTVFYDISTGTRSDISLKKIKENDIISVFGYYSDGKKSFSAKYIYLENPKKHIIGKIADIDKTKFIVTVKDKQGQIPVEFETITKTFTINRDKKNLSKSGFSKLKIGDNIHVIGAENVKDKTKITALKVLAYSAAEPISVTPITVKESTSSSSGL